MEIAVNYFLFILFNYLKDDDLEYLKKTISREGKYVSDDFIRYHQINDQIVEDEDNLINLHMNIIKVFFIFYLFFYL